MSASACSDTTSKQRPCSPSRRSRRRTRAISETKDSCVTIPLRRLNTGMIANMMTLTRCEIQKTMTKLKKSRCCATPSPFSVHLEAESAELSAVMAICLSPSSNARNKFHTTINSTMNKPTIDMPTQTSLTCQTRAHADLTGKRSVPSAPLITLPTSKAEIRCIYSSGLCLTNTALEVVEVIRR